MRVFTHIEKENHLDQASGFQNEAIFRDVHTDYTIQISYINVNIWSSRGSVMGVYLQIFFGHSFVFPSENIQFQRFVAKKRLVLKWYIKNHLKQTFHVKPVFFVTLDASFLCIVRQDV